MDKQLVAKYLKQLKDKTGLTYAAIAEQSGRSESSVKNLFFANVDDPRVDTVSPIVYALGGSMDEMLNPEKSKDELKEVSVSALKEIYEYQIAEINKTNEKHIDNIRTHYGQHHDDMKENYEKRLNDTREMLEMVKSENAEMKTKLQKQEDAHKAEIIALKNEFQTREDAAKHGNIIRNIIIGLFVIGVIVLLVLEFMHPEHGWIRIPTHSQHTHYFGLVSGIAAIAITVFGIFKLSASNKNKKRG